MFHGSFPDRGYAGRSAGASLGARRARGARRPQVVAQAVALAATVDSVCLHGDGPGAVARAVAPYDAAWS